MGLYFREPHPELAALLDAHQERVRGGCPAAVRRKVAGLVLGGGYGRGEGGVLNSPDGERLFNDLDYFLFSSDPSDPELIGWVRRWEKEESRALGIDVECVVLPDSKLKNPEPTMMFSDLAYGHCVVIGSDGLLADWLEALPPASIPLGEATRLLWNRGSGLYFSVLQMDSGEPDSTFVQRNLSKAKLALGDAILCLNHSYSGLAEERSRRLEKTSHPLLTAEILDWHREATAFKLTPRIHNITTDRMKGEWMALAASWSRVFLAVESKRLGLQGEQALADLEAYANYRGSLFPAEPFVRNLMLAVRDRALRGGGVSPAWDYPRGALYRALADLIHTRLTGGSYSHTERWIPETTPQSAPEVHLPHYRKWWQHYS